MFGLGFGRLNWWSCLAFLTERSPKKGQCFSQGQLINHLGAFLIQENYFRPIKTQTKMQQRNFCMNLNKNAMQHWPRPSAGPNTPGTPLTLRTPPTTASWCMSVAEPWCHHCITFLHYLGYDHHIGKGCTPKGSKVWYFPSNWCLSIVEPWYHHCIVTVIITWIMINAKRATKGIFPSSVPWCHHCIIVTSILYNGHGIR